MLIRNFGYFNRSSFLTIEQFKDDKEDSSEQERPQNDLHVSEKDLFEDSVEGKADDTGRDECDYKPL